MAKRSVPEVFKHLVIFLRTLAGLTQAQFGKRCRMDQAAISRMETGAQEPADDVQRRMAKVAGMEWTLVTLLRQFLRVLLEAVARRKQGPAAQPLDLAVLEPVRLAAVPYLLEAGMLEPARPALEWEIREAREIWSRLERHPVAWRRRLIELSPRSASWALALQACEASVRRAAHSPLESLELAELALSIAERVPEREISRPRLLGTCWAYIANARRVACDLEEADAALARAWDLWRTGTGSEELLPEWRLLDLEASLRRDQRRFPEALALLERARVGCDPLSVGHILLNKEHTLEQMGDPLGAMAVLEEASPFVERSGNERYLFALRFKRVNNFCHLQRFDEASALLPEIEEMAARQANNLDLVRLQWLTAKIAAGQGRTKEAMAGLEKVSESFVDLGSPFNAALSALDLAVLYLKEERTAEVKELAVAMNRIFEMKKIGREALASLSLFCEAARLETATVELARRVRGEVERVRR